MVVAIIYIGQFGMNIQGYVLYTVQVLGYYWGVT